MGGYFSQNTGSMYLLFYQMLFYFLNTCISLYCILILRLKCGKIGGTEEWRDVDRLSASIRLPHRRGFECRTPLWDLCVGEGMTFICLWLKCGHLVLADQCWHYHCRLYRCRLCSYFGGYLRGCRCLCGCPNHWKAEHGLGEFHQSSHLAPEVLGAFGVANHWREERGLGEFHRSSHLAPEFLAAFGVAFGLHCCCLHLSPSSHAVANVFPELKLAVPKASKNSLK